jgi:hypothetical protein
VTRLQQGVPAQLSMTWHSGDAVVDPGTVTVTVTDHLGVTLLSGAGTSGVGATPRVLTLPASATEDLSIITAAWSSTTQATKTVRYEVVGGFYVFLGELRKVKDLKDSTKITTAELVEAIDWWMDTVENWCGQSFVPRYGRLDVRHASGEAIYLAPHPRSIQQVTIANTELTSSAWDWDDDGTLYPDRNVSSGRLLIHYTYGLDEPDEELRRAARQAIRSSILSDRTGPPSRQTMLTNEMGTVRLAQPGKRAATGIPEVDRILNDHIYQPVMVG